MKRRMRCHSFSSSVSFVSFVSYPEPMSKDYYGVLGLQKGASADEVKQAYRKLSKELHQDKHKGDKKAEDRFKEVNEAYEVLGNPEKKQRYDQYGSADGRAGFGGAGPGGFDFSGFSGGDAGNFADIFESFFGGGGRGGARSAREERGADREMDMTIDLQDVVAGARKKVTVTKLAACNTCKGSGAETGSAKITCKECGGTGQVTRSAQSFFGTIQQRFICPTCRGSGKFPEKPCRTCGGEGRTEERIELTIDIPAGIDNGQTLRMREQGDAGRQGTQAGDLYVHVRVRPDPRFEREDTDIRSAVTIPVQDAILGTTITVPTLHGDVTLKIPEGTQPGQVFRLKGKGIPKLNTTRMGDHFVTVQIEIPKKLSRAERKLLEEWRELH